MKPSATALVVLACAGCTAANARAPEPTQPVGPVAQPRSVQPVASVAPPVVSEPLVPPPTAPVTSPAPAPAAPSRPPLANPRVSRYREVFTGQMPFRARFQTWTLSLGDDDRFSLLIERAESPENSLIDTKARPLVPDTTIERRERFGSSTKGARGQITLRFDDSPTLTITCAQQSVRVLEAGAVLHLVRKPDGEGNRATWVPSGRRAVDALACQRAGVAEDAHWSDEPQPERLLFVAAPGVEYVHDNDDMVVQKGGLRRAE